MLTALGVRPDQEPDEGETPDFTLLMSGARRSKTAQAVDKSKTSGNCSRWLRMAFEASIPNYVGLMFAASVPPRKQHAQFIVEIANFMRDQCP